jgi:DNA-binding XRE family transcriptional regulator
MKSKDRPHIYFECKSCGKPMYVRRDYSQKHTKICMSCHKKGNKNAEKHGDYKNRLYKIWVGLKFRRKYVLVPEICEEWSDYNSFKTWALENGYQDYLTIDRRNNKKGYEPQNCHWITLQENSGKDKIIFNDYEKLKLKQEREKLKITQIKMAELVGVSRNTVQRAERFIREESK